ncbi:hypothetical protein BDZ97DRAFT_569966 [Flammula alnicola]|nr:hypothetical protein BDZ97DRAFT_569966 [Flammula alnicola]
MRPLTSQLPNSMRGREKKICNACNRRLNAQEFVAFEKHVGETLGKTTTQAIAIYKEELEEWQAELNRLQHFRPTQIARDQLKQEIPRLEEEIKEKEGGHPDISLAAETVGEKLEAVNRQVKEAVALKQQTSTIVRLQKEVDRAEHEIGQLENNLSTTGSTKTADDVQSELSRITSDLRKNDRESKSISSEADRQSRLSRDLENSLHSMELEERDLLNKIREKDRLEQDIERMNQEIATYSPIERHRRQDFGGSGSNKCFAEGHQRVQRELNSKINEAQRLYEELNKVIDRLNDMNKNIERYVKERKLVH